MVNPQAFFWQVQLDAGGHGFDNQPPRPGVLRDFVCSEPAVSAKEHALGDAATFCAPAYSHDVMPTLRRK
jgi:hypothetical protein